MYILITFLGCLLGVVIFKLISMVTPMGSFGDWSVGLLVAFCLIGTSLVSGIRLPSKG